MRAVCQWSPSAGTSSAGRLQTPPPSTERSRHCATLASRGPSGPLQLPPIDQEEQLADELLFGGKALQKPSLLGPTQPWNVPDRVPLPGSEGEHKSGVVIVGGGPTGMAAAMMLAQRGWTDITVLEKREEVDVEEADKSYVYMIDSRGRQMLQHFPNAVEALQRNSVSTEKIDLTIVQSNGKVKERTLTSNNAAKVSHWLPRVTLLRVLRDEVLVPGQLEGWAGSIKVMTHTALQSLQRVPANGSAGAAGQRGSAAHRHSSLLVHVQDVRTGTQQTLRPRLVIGADGLKSGVRATLQQWDQEDAATAASSGGDGGSTGRDAQPGNADIKASSSQQKQKQHCIGSKFNMRVLSSPSANLRFKVLRLPPNPVLSTHDEGSLPLANPRFGVVRAKPQLSLAGNQGLQLGLLPVKDRRAPRTGNVITTPEGNNFWDVHTADELYSYLGRRFPCLPARDLIPPAEAARFAASRGGRFPAPQHCQGGLVYLVHSAGQAGSSSSASTAAVPTPKSQSASSTGLDQHTPAMVAASSGGTGSSAAGPCGVVLLGDARAAFPPDLGQGVNSAFEDVLQLRQALDDTDDHLGKALPLYEARRLPDIRALVELVSFSYPWQYKQSQMGHLVWAVNFAMRALLHKLAPMVFAQHSCLLVQDWKMSYSQVLTLAHRTTQRILALGAAVLGMALVAALYLGRRAVTAV